MAGGLFSSHSICYQGGSTSLLSSGLFVFSPPQIFELKLTFYFELLVPILSHYFAVLHVWLYSNNWCNAGCYNKWQNCWLHWKKRGMTFLPFCDRPLTKTNFENITDFDYFLLYHRHVKKSTIAMVYPIITFLTLLEILMGYSGNETFSWFLHHWMASCLLCQGTFILHFCIHIYIYVCVYTYIWYKMTVLVFEKCLWKFWYRELHLLTWEDFPQDSALESSLMW